MQFANPFDGGNPPLDRTHHTSAPAESLSGKYGFGQIKLSDIAGLAPAHDSTPHGLKPLELTDRMKEILERHNNLNSSGPGATDNPREAAGRAAENMMKNRLDPDIDPGFTYRKDDDRPMHKMIREKIRQNTADIDQKERAAFEKLWNGLTKEQQDQLRKDCKRDQIRPDADNLGLKVIDRFISPGYNSFKNKLIEMIVPLEKERQQRIDGVYKNLTPGQKSALSKEVDVIPV